MGSSKFEFETYRTKKFKTNKLGEREYIKEGKRRRVGHKGRAQGGESYSK